MYSNNPLYQYYQWLQTQQQSPNQNLRTDQQLQDPAVASDSNFNYLWDYLKKLKSAYNLYSKVSGNTPVGDYLNKGWDSVKDMFSGGTETGVDGASGASEIAADTTGGMGGLQLGEGGSQAAEGMGGATLGEMGYTGASTAGAGSGSGLGGLSAGGYAQVAAPLVMAYLKYQGGTGINEPLWKKQQTVGAGNMLKDILSGNQVDPNNTYSKYGLASKNLPSGLVGDPENYPTTDPRGYSAFDLYDMMHSYDTAHPQNQGLGNSGYSPQQVDDMMGNQKDILAKTLGVDNLPDWSKYDSGSGFGTGVDNPWAKSPAALSDAKWYSLHGDSDPLRTNQEAKIAWEKQQQLAELEKFLGYKLDNNSNSIGW